MDAKSAEPSQDVVVAVIGQGIIGLQSALTLLEHGYKVVIIAEHTPRNRAEWYTSPWAGAQWRTHASAQDEELKEADTETYRVWLDLAKEEEKTGKRETGIGIYPSLLYWPSDPPSTAAETWWHTIVSDFSNIPRDSCPQGVEKGVRFTSMVADVNRYLPWLVSRIEALGGKLIQARLPTHAGFAKALAFAEKLAKDAWDGSPIFVNATGLGARTLVGDTKVFPTRGQILLVKGEAHSIRTLEAKDYIDYVLPRAGSGTTVLGGTKEPNIWDTSINPTTTANILRRCAPLAPELLGPDGKFHLLSAHVGLRPSRHGGPRVESEIVDGKYPVVHSYGHSGAGYQNSIGNARKVMRCVELLRRGVRR